MVDSIDFLGMTLSLPEQFESALEQANQVDVSAINADGITSIIVLGMGGSGVTGDIIATTLSTKGKVPVIVNKHYELPSFVGPNTLVIAVSYSGTTEETLSAVQIAQQRLAPMIAVCSGGALEEIAKSSKTPCVVYGAPSGLQPRASMGALVTPVLVALDKLGFYDDGISDVKSAITQVTKRRDESIDREANNIVNELVTRISSTIPIFYGGGALGATASNRCKSDFNENAKAPAYSHYYPELCHNEIVGYGQHGDITRQLLTLVELRHDFEHKQVQRRFEITRELIRETLHDVIEVKAQGETAFAQLVDLCYIGSLMSVYLSIQKGVDPGPVDIIWELKNALA